MQPKAYSYIRFSSPEQENGDSLRRQTEATEEYAKLHGLELDKSLSLQDKGLSAFRGTHIKKGGLGEFLHLVENGNIARGSLLIIENIDRFSREQAWSAYYYFVLLIRAGVEIVTLHDKTRYNEENLDDLGKFIGLVLEMDRSHKESKYKSSRNTDAWKAKRNNTHKEKLTAKCPHWLEPIVKKVDEKKKIIKGFKLIPDRAPVIKLIFEMKLNGKGPRLTAKELNHSGCWQPPPIRRNSPGGWQASYINKILRNRAVLGEFQPYRFISQNGNRKREPIGDPIPNYYPRVVPDSLFYAVKEQIDANKKDNGEPKGGRIADKVSNLFTHLAKCGYCGGAMHFINKGQPPKGGTYLVCEKAKRKADGNCAVPSHVRYGPVEWLILTFIRGLKTKDLFPNAEVQQTELEQLERQLVAKKGELDQLKGKIDSLIDSIEYTRDRGVKNDLMARLIQRNNERDALEKERADLEKRISELSTASETVDQKLENIDELLLALVHSEEPERVALRLRLREQLKGILKQVNIYPKQVQEIELVYRASGKSRFLQEDQLERYLLNIRRRLKGLK